MPSCFSMSAALLNSILFFTLVATGQCLVARTMADRRGKDSLSIAPFECKKHYTTENIVLWPEKKIAFCAIPKIASTQFIKLFIAMNKGVLNDKSIATRLQEERRQMDAWPDGKPYGERNSPWRSKIDANLVKKGKGWFKGIFLREPTERVLDAWLSKCIRKPGGWVEDDGGQCHPGEVQPANVTLGSPESVAAFEDFVLTMLPGFRLGGNQHFDPQRCFCGGLSNDLSEYSYVQHFRGDYSRTNLHVQEMLRQAGLEANKTKPLADTFFPSIDPHSEHAAQAASRVQLYYRNPAVRNTIKTLYAHDYNIARVLGLVNGGTEPYVQGAEPDADYGLVFGGSEPYLHD